MATLMERMRFRAAQIIGGQKVTQQLSAADLLYGQVRVPPVRGSWEFLLAYRSSPLLRMLTAKVMQSVASVDWYVTIPGKKGGERIEDHPLPKLLKAGNEMMTGFDVRKLSIGHYVTVGEAHWLLERNGLGVPVGILPMVPTWVVTTPRPGRPWYDVAVTEGGFVGRIAASEVISFKDLDLYRPYDRGTGVAMSLDNELGADAEAARYTNAYLLNNARPDLVITGNTANGATGLQPSEVDSLSKAWNDKFGGPSNRGKPLFSSGDLKVMEIGKSMAEMQFTELRKFERDLCISVYGIPPEIVGVLLSSNKATVQAAQVTLARQVVVPLLTTLRETMQQRLVPQFDDRLKLDFENPVPDDQEMLNTALTARPWMASINEHRASTGLDPIDGPDGDLFPEPITLSFVTQLGPAAEAEPVTPPPGKQIKARKASKDDKDAIANAAQAGVIIDSTEPLIREIVQQFGTDAAASVDIGISFDLSDPAVTGFIGSYGADRITGMVNDTTRQAIRDAISTAYDDGGTMDDITGAIEDVFSIASSSRARTIAATETNRAANFASQEGMSQAGAEGKSWLSTEDDLVRDTDQASHVALDGQEVAIDEDFQDPVSGEAGPYPGGFSSAAETVNCRCQIVPVITMNDGEEASGLRRTSIYDTPEKRSRAWRMQDRQKLAFEKHFVVKLKSAFAKQKVAVLREARRRLA